MSAVETIFLHGFLGLGQDWQAIRKHLNKDIETHCPNLFDKHSYLGPHSTFEQWPSRFKYWVHEQFSPSSKKIIIGYSLGGRLALQFLLKYPDIFSHAILISANPGLLSHDEKKERLKHDQQLAQQFQSQPWEELMEKWHQQSLFQSDKIINRNETDFNRQQLALALENWSVAHHQIGSDTLQQLKSKITWICGAQDSKFQNIYDTLQNSGVPGIYYHVPNAGHRVIFDSPQFVAQAINTMANQ